VPVEVLWVSGGLALAEVLDHTELVSGNGLNVLNDFLDNDCLGVGVLNSLVVDGLGGAIE